MGMYAVDAADAGDLDELSTSAREGRAAARSRRLALSQGKQALNGDGDGTAAATGAGAPPAAENLPGNGAGAPPAASNGQGAPSGAQGAPGGTSVATDGVAADDGRAVAMSRRRQLSQGQQALNGGVNGAEAPAASNGQGAPSGGQGAPGGTSVATGDVTADRDGRAVARSRRRQLSQGQQALNGAGAPSPAASNGQRAPSGAQGAPGGTAAGTDGRAVARSRRRQLSQGQQGLTGDGAPPAAVQPALLHGRAAEQQAENLGDDAGSGREKARARRAEASRFGTAGISRPQREGQVTYPPKVIVSATHGGQRVTGLRIGPGVRVTGDEAGTTLPVSGPQYVAADGPARELGAGPKVGLVRTPQGLVVSGTTVRGKVPITGDEAGEHLPITGEADQKLDDDLTPRSDGAYRSAQFPRRADPHGASAVGTRLGLQRRWVPLAATDGGLVVTGTAVGRSGRVTGNEAGVCRPITGDQYQDPYSSECGDTGGGTAPAAHLNGAGRLDPVTAGKVTVAQTWRGQRVTGPSVEYRPNVTGDEPGVCRPVTGTPYQGPPTVFGWCEPDEGESAAQRLEPRPEGVALTGDVPMPAEGVTGTTELRPLDTVTGTPYYRDLRTPEPAADDWARSQAFPVALARRLAGGESDDATTQGTNNGAPPPSSVPGRITGSFAVGDGKVTGNNEFLFRPRLDRDGRQPPVTGEGSTEGRTVTGSDAWTAHDLVTGTEGYIAARRNPSEGGGGPNGWAGAGNFKYRATHGGPPRQLVTGRSGWSAKAAANVTVSGGAQG